MNRSGEVTLRGSLQNSQQVTDFRTKLIDSGFFAAVSVEEQLPSPDRQKVTVRMTAHWKPIADRIKLAIGPTPEEIEKSKAAKEKPPGAGGMPEGAITGEAMPPGLPPGIVFHN